MCISYYLLGKKQGGGSSGGNEKLKQLVERNGTTFEIPDEVTQIGTYAFYNWTTLTDIKIPNSVISISDYAFQSCSGLKKMTIPGTTTYTDYSFNATYNIEEFVITGEEISDITAGRSNNSPWCKSNSNIKKITIQNTVKTIGQWVFGGLTNLKEIEIPNSVTKIKSYAFSGCSKLETIKFGSDLSIIYRYCFQDCTSIKKCDFSTCLQVPTLEFWNIFNKVASDCKIIVPDALYDDWIVAENWTYYTDKIVKASEYVE